MATCARKCEIRREGQPVAQVDSELEAYKWIQENTPFSLAFALAKAGYVIVPIDEIEKWLDPDEEDETDLLDKDFEPDEED